MADAPVDHGMMNAAPVNQKPTGGTGLANSHSNMAYGSGSAALSAASTTTVSNTNIPSGCKVALYAITSGAAQTLKEKAWWIDGHADGTFTINFSATAAGLPAATDVVGYVWAAFSEE